MRLKVHVHFKCIMMGNHYATRLQYSRTWVCVLSKKVNVKYPAVPICIGEQAVHLHVYRETILHVPSDSKYGLLPQLRSHIFRRVISLTLIALPICLFFISLSSENLGIPAGCFLVPFKRWKYCKSHWNIFRSHLALLWTHPNKCAFCATFK